MDAALAIALAFVGFIAGVASVMSFCALSLAAANEKLESARRAYEQAYRLIASEPDLVARSKHLRLAYRSG
jgi:hypothetical protein